ncbi:hypothetical protein QQS21_011016 [Conoideocrella luteorostrata]|uniref:Uncharacterized protein n=1 Tax=Conoideocrella luteorostrata TaxID=1105319 RepID=A0AAJ0FU50_9HYPO|nr:hypothetical protein QQS21_011016 [Conoideocrella luteorostrata]
MKDDCLIDNLIGLEVTSNGTVHREDDDDGGPGITSDDIISDLRETMITMKVTIDTMDKRINQLELDVNRLTMNGNRERPRNVAMIPNSTVQSSANNDDGADSFSNVSKARSDLLAPSGVNAPNTSMIRFAAPNPTIFSSKNWMSFKNNSAASNRGYDNKHSLWETAFASLMVACMRKYIEKSGESGHIVDEIVMMKT